MGPFASSGILEVYVNQTWGNVCNRGFNSTAADTTCRQMGYTNALTFGSTNTKSASVVWLDGVECGPESHECLSYCFTKPPVEHVPCPANEYVTLHCIFNSGIDSGPWTYNMTPGSADMCSSSIDFSIDLVHGCACHAGSLTCCLFIYLVTCV